MTLAKAESDVSCWNCRAPAAGKHFCPACGKIQPLAPGTDYFALFGLPQRLLLDEAALEQRFHELSWKLHPDNFVRAGERERALSLDLSSELNDAYRALRDPLRRVEYLLARHGLRKEGQTKQQAPPELLEEVFELNESLDELRAARRAGSNGNAAALAGLRDRLLAAEKQFEGRLEEVDQQLKTAAGQWDGALDSGAEEVARQKVMERMNEILNRRSYIRNLVANVQQELADE